MMKLISGCIGKKSISIIVLLFVAISFLPSLTTQVHGDGSETEKEQSVDDKEDKEQGSGSENTIVSGSNSFPAEDRLKIVFVTAGLIISVFMGILFLGWLTDRNLDKGEMRRAIAGTFVIGFTILMILCLVFNIYQKEVVIAYIELVGIVIGFYFGAKVAGEKKFGSAASAQSEESEIKELKKKIIDYYNANSSDQGKVVTAINNTGYTDWKNFIGGRPGEPSLRNLEQIKEELKI